ncbi:MAG: Hsp70 family protein [Frankia sp.]|nr:Hsp70 family protein [Frankia sp.]
MGYQLGIDIGSANTIVALSDGDWPQVLTIAGGSTIPTVVYLPARGGVLFGRAANRRALTDPSRAAEGFLRRVGDPTPILVGGSAFTPEGLLTRFVEQVVGAVTAERGEAPNQVVITCPTSWNQRRRELFTEAVEALEVPVSVVPAAEAFGAVLSRRANTRTPGVPADLIAVYDFGAGLFDAAVLSFSDYGADLVGSPAGVNHAGGADLDSLLLDHILATAGQQAAGLDRSDPATVAALGRLRAEIVTAKETLAADEEVAVPVTLPGYGGWVTLTRAELELLVTPAVEDTVRALQRVVRSVPASADQLSAVLLYGGVSRMPLVGRLVREALPGARRYELRPAEDLAIGAALLAAGIAEQNEAPLSGDTALIGQASLVPPEPGSFPGVSVPPSGPVSSASLAAAEAAGQADPDSTIRSRGPLASPPGQGHAQPPTQDPNATVLASQPGQGYGYPSVPATTGAYPGPVTADYQATALASVPAGARGGAGAGAAGGVPGQPRQRSPRSRGGILALVAALLFVGGGTALGITLSSRGDDDGAQEIISAPTRQVTASGPPAAPTTEPPVDVKNLVRVANSGEVAPISEAAFAGLRQTEQNVTVTFDTTTTEDAFSKLCAGEVAVAGASFELNPDFAPGCSDQVVAFEIAHHTLPIVLNPQNNWLRCLDIPKLRQIWGSGSTVTKWSDINPSYPDQPIRFVGPARDSVQAREFNANISQDSNGGRDWEVTDLAGVAQTVSSDVNAFGFLDFPTYEIFGDRLKGLLVDAGTGCTEPSAIAAGTGAYVPLCKPLFVYARADALRDPATVAYLRYYLQNAQTLAQDNHYVPRSDKTTADNVRRLDELSQGVGPVTA